MEKTPVAREVRDGGRPDVVRSPSLDSAVAHSAASVLSVSPLYMTKDFFSKYGLSFVMVASYFGAGSIFIASDAGVRFGYTLIWAVVGAVALGFMGQDMSARVGISGSTLMSFTRRKLGKGVSLALSLFLALGCVLWCLELTAAVGKGIELLFGLEEGMWKPLAYVTAAAAMLTGVLDYAKAEKVMTYMMFVLLALYLVVAILSGPAPIELAAGFVPRIISEGALLSAVAILGTTALWPNFFLESTLVKEKGWTRKSDLPEVRRDLALGYAVGGVITIAIIVVAAAVLRPAGFTELESFLTPGLALEQVLGQWARTAFLIGAVAAAFNSIVPIMWTPAYMIMRSLDLDPEGGRNRTFKWIYAVGILLGSLSPVVNDVFGLSVIDMIILFPAYNGAVGLPIAALLLFWAVNSKSEMGEHRNGWKMNLLNSLLVILSLYAAFRSVRGILDAIFGGGLGG